MLTPHTKKRQEAVDNWLDKNKSAAKHFLFKHKRKITGLLLLCFICIGAFFVAKNADMGQFVSFSKISAKNLDRLSEDAFRKIIGYDYGEKIYARDTAEIRSRLEASDMIFGDVRFSIKLIPYELEIKFSEARPLFALMPHSSESMPVIYSDKGKFYPYSVNVADLPIVEAEKLSEVHLATIFLNEMKKSDVALYSRVSQIIPSEEERQIAVFFNDVNFKTQFSLESDYWKTAFKHYRQLTRNMRVSNLDSASVLDLRFRQLAYTKTNGGHYGR